MAEGSGAVEADGWSAVNGAWWFWGPSSARTTMAEGPLYLAEAQVSELPAVPETSCLSYRYFIDRIAPQVRVPLRVKIATALDL